MRLGVIGYGYIGRALVDRIQNSRTRFEVAFVYNRSAEAMAELDASLRLNDLANAAASEPDLIVECAHPRITAQFGVSFLRFAHYMPLSVTALADDELRERLETAATDNGTKLFLPAGALVGGEALLMRERQWDRVRITFRKHPDNIDFADSGYAAEQIDAETVIYEGTVRGIANLYPRNVNTMVTCALASIGLDRCEARLVCDPGLDCAVAEVEAWGTDGSMVRTEKRQPAVGVSGTEMLSSAWYSIQRAAGNRTDAIELV